jgi:hypothetical protein
MPKNLIREHLEKLSDAELEAICRAAGIPDSEIPRAQPSPPMAGKSDAARRAREACLRGQ